MEHDDRSPVATFFSDASPTVGDTVILGESAAHHARVKRLERGDRVRVTDGAGNVGAGPILGIRRGAIDVLVERVERRPRPSPIHLRVPIGDRDRMLWLAEKATELGVTTWQSVRFHRSRSVSPRGEGEAFSAKLRARMVGALEQSGGGWLPRILPEADAGPESIAYDESAKRILLDIAGTPLFSLASLADGREPVILFGPEGGLEPDERDALLHSGWHASSLAHDTLRFETAGVAAVAVLRAAQLEQDR